MTVSDQRIIEFFCKSPIKSFATMVDVLRYLQGGQAIRADIEYELFDWALGDNPRNKVYIRVPEIRGIPITANSLFKLTEHFKKFHFVRRRPHKTRGPHADPDDELTVFYDLTQRMLKLLEGIERARASEKRRGGK